MYAEYSENTGSYSGVGPHTIAEYAIQSGGDVAGSITIRVAGLTDNDETVSGEFKAHFKRVGSVVTVGGVTAAVALAAPLGCVFDVEANQSGDGSVHGRLTGVLGFAGDVAARCDVWVGP